MRPSNKLLSSLLLLACLLALLFAPVTAADEQPTLAFSTYLGGPAPENAEDVAVDTQGYIYVVGNTHSANFPTVNAYQDTLAGFSDVYLIKLNPTGTAIVYSTYLGGSDYDKVYGLALDSDGSVYVTGRTDSNDFPTVNPVQSAYSGMGDAFVAKLSPDGSELLYSTYLGGNGSDAGFGISVDAAKHAHMVGFTESSNLPTHNPYQAFLNGSSDVFVSSLNESGSALDYLTYLGGSRIDNSKDMTIDADGNLYFAGTTTSTDFPLINPLQSAHATPSCIPDNSRNCTDVFVARFNSSGILTYSTYLGGNNIDDAHGIALDNDKNIYITGETNSTDFPTFNAYQPNQQGNASAFITKLNAAGSSLIYSTYLSGSNGYTVGMGIAVNALGNAAVTGYTDAIDFPTFKPIQAARGGLYTATDAFITLFKPDGSALEFSTYLGGSEDEYNEFNPRIAINPSDGSLHVVGTTFSLDFPVYNALQADPGGDPLFFHPTFDAFIAKIDFPLISFPAEAAERNYFTTHTPTLTWKPVTWALAYRVQVNQGQAFDVPHDFEGDAPASADSITTDYLENGFYYWRIQTQRPDGSRTAWKVMDSFTVSVDD